jgi:glycosyltransferase involved in cell wall biosynthesis
VRKFLMRKTTVYRIASDLDLVAPDDKRPDVHDRIFAFGFAFTDFFIAQNPAQQRLLESEKGKKSTVIRNALRDTAQATAVAHKKETVLWVGRGIPLKQPMKFVELARSLPGERFVMVFPGKGELKDEVTRHSRGLDNLEVIDFVDPTRGFRTHLCRPSWAERRWSL